VALTCGPGSAHVSRVVDPGTFPSLDVIDSPRTVHLVLGIWTRFARIEFNSLNATFHSLIISWDTFSLLSRGRSTDFCLIPLPCAPCLIFSLTGMVPSAQCARDFSLAGPVPIKRVTRTPILENVVEIVHCRHVAEPVTVIHNAEI
jgi:hypothetical protein